MHSLCYLSHFDIILCHVFLSQLREYGPPKPGGIFWPWQEVGCVESWMEQKLLLRSGGQGQCCWGTRGRGEETFLMRVDVLIGRSFFCLCESADWDNLPASSVCGASGVRKGYRSPWTLGLGGKGFLVLLTTEHKMKET